MLMVAFPGASAAVMVVPQLYGLAVNFIDIFRFPRPQE